MHPLIYSLREPTTDMIFSTFLLFHRYFSKYCWCFYLYCNCTATKGPRKTKISNINTWKAKQ